MTLRLAWRVFWVSLALLALLVLATRVRATEPPSDVYLPRVDVNGEPPRRGLALVGCCADVAQLGGGWQYGWSTKPQDCAGSENVPMVWCDEQIGQPLGGNSAWVLGFNEPDLGAAQGQCDLPGGTAGALVAEVAFESEYDCAHRPCTSPATLIFENAFDGQPWLTDLYAQMGNYGYTPHWQAVAYHWYGCTFASFKAAALSYRALADSWNVPQVWLTEFGFGNWCNNPLPQMAQAMAWLDSDAGQAVVDRYAHFGTRHPLSPQPSWWPEGWYFPLLEAPYGDCGRDGGLTPRGELYAGSALKEKASARTFK